MKMESKTLKENKLFFIIAPILVVLFLVLSIFINKTNDKSYLDEEDLASGETKVGKLVINEIMTSNKGAYPDGNGKLYDYVELYNGNDHDVNLKEYGLSDVANSVKWVFPNTTIKAKGYIIVFLSGTNDQGLYANFKLKNAGGENIALRNPNGKIIDAITTVSTTKNTVMARNLDGNWVVQTKPTPGYANTTEGYEQFQKSLISEEASGLLINEILPNNQGNFKDNLGNYSGYIEIINKTGKTINLKNYGLSNEEAASFKWQFPDISITNNEVLLVYTSNRNIKDGILHTSFKLNNNNGVIVLSNNQGKIINKVEYKNVPNGMAYIRTDSNYEIGSSISPGYQNDNSGINKFQSTVKISKTLIISEAMSSNYKYLAQNGGKYYDWVELKNNSNETINLKDYYLTTSKDNMTMYQLPDKELKKGEYYIIMASGNTSLSNNSYKHSNFKISSIESLYITHKNEIIDSLFIAEVPVGYSIGKGTNSGIYYYKTPTPKEKNGSGTSAIAYLPTISKSPGVYNDIKSLKVELTGTGTIYYTLDGSKPTTSSKVYSSPISLKKTTVIKYIAKESGKLTSKVGTASYIINEKHTLPVVSVSLNQSNFSRLNSSIWAGGYEVAAHVEYFEEGKEGFSEAIGLQLFGGQARVYNKKSYEITFKKKYGNGSLEYQVFDNRDFSSFENLVLRTGSQDEHSLNPRKILIKDALATSIMEEYTDIDTRTFKYCVLYINGKYWGLYSLREKIDENMIKNHYNIDSTNTSILGVDGNLKHGSRTSYNNLLSYVRNHSMSNNKYYEEVKKKLDIENFIDYWIAEQWIANVDMVNTYFFSNPKIDDGRLKPIFYDLDRSFFTYTTNSYAFTMNPGGMGNGTGNYYSTELLRNLMKNKEFKKLYLERLSYNLKNVWTEENVLSNMNEIINQIKGELPRNFKKWGNNMTTWNRQVNYVKKFIKNRNTYMKKYAKSYFNLSNSEYKKYFG